MSAFVILSSQNQIVMSSQLYVRIPAKDYLARYCAVKFGVPTRFPKKSHLNLLIYEYLIHKDYSPEEIRENQSYIELELPRFRNKNVEYYNSISKAGQLAIRTCLSNLLFLEYFQDTMRKYKKGETIDSALWHFIEKYDLPASCFDTFRKRVQREKSKLGIPGEKVLAKEIEFVSDTGDNCPDDV